MAPNVHIVILCWNGRRWLEACLDSVLRTDYPCFRVLLLDNASTDGSADYVRRRFPAVDLVENARNFGFAGGNNRGIRLALKRGADYVVLLNQDTRVHPNWIAPLVRTAEAHPGLGILSPFQYDYEDRELDAVFESLVQDNTAYAADRETGEIREYYPVPTAIGAALMVRRETVERLGAFDPVYFAYFEEKDLCRRVLAAGCGVALVPESRIMHWHGHLHAAESGARVNTLFRRNRQIYLLKDPTRSFWKNLYVYLRYGLPGSLSGRYDPHLPAPGFGRALAVQLGVMLRLPRIAWRRWQDQRRIRRFRRRSERG